MRRPIKTKAQLLRFMSRHDACPESGRWVREQKLKTAAGLVKRCPRPDWVQWLLHKLWVSSTSRMIDKCPCCVTRSNEARKTVTISWLRGTP
jgi:hypothetical protein